MEVEIDKITDSIRDKNRSDIAVHRAEHRTGEWDMQRTGVDSKIIRPHEVLEVVKQLKARRSKKAHFEAMHFFSYAFEQSAENTDVFVAVPGAMEMLVKKLSDVRENQQVHASECLCNMALSGRRASGKIVRMAGGYLVAYLDSELFLLRRNSLWCLGNIIGVCAAQSKESGSRETLKLLLAMDICKRLWLLLTQPDNEQGDESADLATEAGEILQHLVMNTQLRRSDQEFLVKHLSIARMEENNMSLYLSVLDHSGVIQAELLGAAEVQLLLDSALSLILAKGQQGLNILAKMVERRRLEVVLAIREWTTARQTHIVSLATSLLDDNPSEALRRSILTMTSQFLKIPQSENVFPADELLAIWGLHKSILC